MNLSLLPIDIDPDKNVEFYTNDASREFVEVYPAFYAKVGFSPPWTGYFVKDDEDGLVAVCGFKGPPKDRKIEIAYGTFKAHEGKGIGTRVCKLLVNLSLNTDPTVRIMARTLPEKNASTSILRKNGFEWLGEVMDEEDGKVWEWELKSNS